MKSAAWRKLLARLGLPEAKTPWGLLKAFQDCKILSAPTLPVGADRANYPPGAVAKPTFHRLVPAEQLATVWVATQGCQATGPSSKGPLASLTRQQKGLPRQRGNRVRVQGLENSNSGSDNSSDSNSENSSDSSSDSNSDNSSDSSSENSSDSSSENNKNLKRCKKLTKGAKRRQKQDRRRRRTLDDDDEGVDDSLSDLFEWVTERGPIGDAPPVLPSGGQRCRMRTAYNKFIKGKTVRQVRNDLNTPTTIRTNASNWVLHGQEVLDKLELQKRRQLQLKDKGIITRSQWDLLRTEGGLGSVFFSSKELRTFQTIIDDLNDDKFGFKSLEGHTGVMVANMSAVIDEIKADILHHDPDFFNKNPGAYCCWQPRFLSSIARAYCFDSSLKQSLALEERKHGENRICICFSTYTVYCMPICGLWLCTCFQVSNLSSSSPATAP
jgi:hypothetical protein